MAVIDKKYHNLCQKILDEGYDYLDESRDVMCKQLSSYEFRHNFKDGFPAISTKKLAWKSVKGELLWFLSGDSDIRTLWKDNIHIWDKDWYNKASKEINKFTGKPWNLTLEDYIKIASDKDEKSMYFNKEFWNLGPIYGVQWRHWKAGIKEVDCGRHDMCTPTVSRYYIDQITNLINNLRDKPMSRRHIVTSWDIAELDKMALPPCHWSFEILPRPLSLEERIEISWTHKNKIPKGKISLENFLNNLEIPKYTFDLKWHQRSVDTFLGLPFNIASYGLLAHMIGKITNMIPNELIGDLSNIHIYEPHVEAVKEQLSRDTDKYWKPVELEIKDRSEYDRLGKERISISNFLSNIEITDFILRDYNSFLPIKAEMIEPKI